MNHGSDNETLRGSPADSRLKGACGGGYSLLVTTAQIIEEIKHLSLREQAEVIRFTSRLDAER